MSFNPVKEEVDGKKAHSMIWSTDIIDKAIHGLEQGKKLVANPFYENNTKLLKGDLVFNRTKEEIEEWKHCKEDIIYFANNYCKLMTPQGIQKVEMRDYQEEYLRHLEKNRLSILLSARQAGKTTTSAIFLLHYILFNVDKNSLVLGNKAVTAREILDKIKKIFYEIPYFLKPGIYKWNEGEIVLDNGCRCMAEATTINSGISFTFHCVLADEFAHIHPNILDKFYNNLFPTITAGKARFIISSTQNGFNLFYRLYKAAENGENEYAPFKVDWWQVPEWNPDKQCWEKRDEKWRKIQIANYGSEEAFNQQFGTNFDTKQNTLISSKFLRKMQTSAVEYKEKELPGVTLSQFYFWRPDYEPLEDLRKDSLVITIDIAEGGGGDYTVFVFNKIINETHFETIGYFRCNECDIKSCVVSLRQLCIMYMTPDRYAISIEQNLYGELFVKLLKEEIESHIDEVNLFNESVLCKYWENSVKFSTTIKITHANKTRACIMLKNDLERGLLKNFAAAFVNEALNFCDSSGNGTYKAQYGHDDFMMAQTQIELAKDTYEVKNLIEGVLIGNNRENSGFNIYDTSNYNYGGDDIYSMQSYGNGQDIYSMSANNNGNDIYSF